MTHDLHNLFQLPFHGIKWHLSPRIQRTSCSQSGGSARALARHLAKQLFPHKCLTLHLTQSSEAQEIAQSAAAPMLDLWLCEVGRNHVVQIQRFQHLLATSETRTLQASPSACHKLCIDK